MSDTDLRDERSLRTPRCDDHEARAREQGAHILKHTCDLGRPPFWCAYEKVRGLLLNHAPVLPEGVKPYPNVAQAFVTEQMFKMGMVELRYKDGSRTALTLKELVPVGDTIDIDQITEKWVVCEKGDRDLTGRAHE